MRNGALIKSVALTALARGASVEAEREALPAAVVQQGGDSTMHAKEGDRVIVRSRRVGQHERIGRIVEVRGENGAPPYVVHWTDNDQEGLFVPGSDATIEPRPGSRAS
jgi:hypothetical protein